MAKRIQKKVQRLTVFGLTLDESKWNIQKETMGLSFLLETLLNKRYNGPDLKLVNIYFASMEYAAKHASLTLGYAYNDINVAIIFDQQRYESSVGMDYQEYVWALLCEALLIVVDRFKVHELGSAVEAARSEGLALGLHTDQILLQREKVIGNLNVQATIWISFTAERMFSTLVVSIGSRVIYKSELDQAGAASEYMMIAYKDLVISEKAITVKYRYDAPVRTAKFPMDYGIVN